MDKSILFAAIAGAVLIGAIFALVQPVEQAQTVHTSFGSLFCFEAKSITENAGNYSATTNRCTAP